MCLGLTYATWNPVLKTNWPTSYLPTKAELELASAEKSGVFIMLPEGNSTCSTCLLKNLFCTFVVKVAKARSKGKLITEWKGPHLNGCQSEQRAHCRSLSILPWVQPCPCRHWEGPPHWCLFNKSLVWGGMMPTIQEQTLRRYCCHGVLISLYWNQDIRYFPQIWKVPASFKWGMVAHTHHPSALDVEAEGSEVQGHSQLHSELQASLSRGRPV